MRRSSIALLVASLAVPALVLVPWALFGDAVPDGLMSLFGPRNLARAVLLFGGGSIALFVIALVRLFREAKRSDDPSRAFRRMALAAGAIVLACLVTTGTIFGWYASRHDAAIELCSPALRASTVSERKQALAAAEPYRRQMALFNEQAAACERLEQELAELERGRCPEVVPADARCTCGAQRFPEDWPEPASPRCDAYDDRGDFVDEKRLRRMRGY